MISLSQKHTTNTYSVYTENLSPELLLLTTLAKEITQHIQAAFHSIINRLLNISFNNTDYNTEVNTTKYIADKNGNGTQTIETQITKRKKFHTNIQYAIDNNKRNRTLTHQKKSE